MKKKNLSAKPRMIACNPNRSSSRNKTYCEVQASHPWLSNKFLILMEDLSSSISYPCIDYRWGRKTRASTKEKSLLKKESPQRLGKGLEVSDHAGGTFGQPTCT
ncbi:hypothetical protein V6N12_022210 [Hibiscus sabdariffa]|uniref:Uncharacterized protein n=1 Tax=Hibiscus sabdariffa TaxID=183260 RepID=A0ABR2FUJ6_9ROSI